MHTFVHTRSYRTEQHLILKRQNRIWSFLILYDEYMNSAWQDSSWMCMRLGLSTFISRVYERKKNTKNKENGVIFQCALFGTLKYYYFNGVGRVYLDRALYLYCLWGNWIYKVLGMGWWWRERGRGRYAQKLDDVMH